MKGALGTVVKSCEDMRWPYHDAAASGTGNLVLLTLVVLQTSQEYDHLIIRAFLSGISYVRSVIGLRAYAICGGHP